jgi:hypothetical protein
LSRWLRLSLGIQPMTYARSQRSLTSSRLLPQLMYISHKETVLYELYEGGGRARTEARTEREIVEAAAARGVEVVRQHRVHLAKLYRVSHTLPNPVARELAPRTTRTLQYQKCAPPSASQAYGKPVRGGSNPSPKRSGPADSALPVEIHLSSRGWGERATRRRGGTSRLTGYEPGRTKEAKWNATSRRLGTSSHRSPWRVRVGGRTARTAYPQSREPNPGHTRERCSNPGPRRSGPV